MRGCSVDVGIVLKRKKEKKKKRKKEKAKSLWFLCTVPNRVVERSELASPHAMTGCVVHHRVQNALYYLFYSK